MRDRVENTLPPGNRRLLSTLLLGLLFSLVLAYGVIESQLGEKRRAFERDSQAATLDYRYSLREASQLLTNFELLFESSSFVSEEEFLRFVRPQMSVGGFVGVVFLGLLDGDNPYARPSPSGDSHQPEVPYPFAIGEGEGEGLRHLAYRYMARRDGVMQGEAPEAHLIHILGESNQQLIAQAMGSGEQALGGMVGLKRENDTLVIYQPVFSENGRGRHLIGVLAVLLDPLAALERVQASHLLNVQLYIGSDFVGESLCCDSTPGAGFSTLQHETNFVLSDRPFRLLSQRHLSWQDVGVKWAVVAFLLGILVTFFAHRLRVATAERVTVLQERNRIIRRKVDEQTQSLRLSTVELQQQKAALDQHAIVSIADTGGSITYVNDKFCEISGYTRDELIGRTHRIVKSDRHPTSFYDEMWSAISQGRVWHGEICNRNRDGGEYWVSSSIVPFLDEWGLPYQYVSIRTDITEVKLATQMLQARELELDTILNTVPALIWFKDREGRILRVNRQAADLMESTPAEVEGHLIDELFPEDAERYRDADRQVIESGEPLMGLLEEITLPTGHYFFRLDRVPYSDPQGNVIGVVVMAVDVTRQEEAERSLVVNEERLRRSQTFANIGTWDWSIQSGELFWSERIAPLFGYAVGELDTTYENFLGAVHPDDRELVSSAVAACVESGVEYNIEHRVVWPDGQVRWLSEKGDVVRDANGAPLHMLGVVQDIHERKMAEAALQESELHLKEAQRMGRIGHWTLDMVSGELYWSDEIYRIFGRQPGEFAPSFERFSETVHPDDVALVKAFEEGLRASGKHKVDHRIITADGTLRWVHEEATAFRNSAGEIERMVGTVQDISERKLAEAALSENEEKFRSLYELSPVGIALNSLEGDFLDANQAFHDIVGYTAEECSGLTYWELTPEEYAPQEAEQLESLHTYGRYGPYEKEYLHKDGHRVAVLLNGTIVHDREGQQRIWSIVQDISERKDAENALNRFKTTLDVTKDCVFMFDPQELRFFYVNQGAMDQVGYSQSELMQMHPYDIKPEHDAGAFRKLVEPLVSSGGGSVTFETQHQHKDGHIIPVEIGLQYIAPESEPPRFVAIVRNITERVALQNALDDQRQLLDMMHRSITDFVVQSDFHQTTNNMLDALLELTGSEYGFTGEVHYDDDGSPYLKMHAITNIAWDAKTQKLYDEFTLKGLEFRNLNTLYGHVMTSGKPVMSNDPGNDTRSAGLPEGHPPMENFLGVPVYYGEDLVGMYGIANRKAGFDDALLEFLRPFDTTYGVIIHSKRIAVRDAENREALLGAKREAEHANKAKSEFLSSMSHELRTPMNAILGFTQLMTGDENLTAEQRESLHDIASAGNHLLELINGVLDLAKIEAGKMELSISSVAIADVMASVKNLILPMVAKRDVELLIDPSCLEAGMVRADFTRTKQVLLNLLSNAVKYNRKGGRIQVACRVMDHDRLRISVSDNGRGIPQVKLQGLFEAFNRLEAEGSNIEGTGIGLVITRQLVELMGGTVGVDSVVDEGSTFWFELPRAQGVTARRARLPSPVEPGDGGLGAGRSVLYIEDNPVNLKLVSKLIEKRTSVTLFSAEEPVHGIELALAQRPDLILLDINLPEMNGYEVLRHLRQMEATRDIPVVALSANAMAADLQRGEEAGFNGYLTKPINVKAFLGVLERMLG